MPISTTVCFDAVLASHSPNDYYIGHRPPLQPSPFQKLPIGSIKPKGWLRRQLELQAEGFSGCLSQISKFLDKQNNAWLNPELDGRNGWEEVPYWLKGHADLGFILGDQRIIDEAMVWIEGALKSQREDGWFGPISNLNAKDGKPDLWPNMIMMFVLQSYHEYSADPRVLELLTKYCRWLLALPGEEFLHKPTYWHYHRGGDNLISVLWLYNRTGEPFLLDLAHKIHRHTADWTSGVPDTHGVNFAQAFREPATYWLLSGEAKHLNATEADLRAMRGEYGQFPGGMYGADENTRKGCTDPRQAAETCAMVEMMYSYEFLLGATGDPRWADRCEDVAFNSFPASMTPDLKALRYLTAANMVLSDRGNKHPGISNTGPMFVMDPNDHRCCQHNVAQGWPYYAEHLWLATNGNGLAAALFAESEVTAKVGDGETVTIEETTDYPFRERVGFKVRAERPVAFPLSIRVPIWCSGSPTLTVNGEPQSIEARGAGYLTIDREWKHGDEVTVEFPTKIEAKTWPAQQNSVSVSRGPLAYSLRIEEEYRRSGGTDAWPAFEIHPMSDWNYGLDPEAPLELILRPMPEKGQPFALDSVPLAIKAKARRIPNWRADHLGMVGALQPSPARVDTEAEAVELVPMGAARLRVAMFPTVSTESGSRWQEPPEPSVVIPASASHVNPSDTLAALSDSLTPKSSSDLTIPRFTWWDRKGSTEWVQYDFPETKFIGKVEVYWYDDGERGLCRTPESWRLLYLEDGDWVEAKPRGELGTKVDQFNVVEFMPFASAKMRIEANLKPGFSGGILEWRFR